MDWCSRCKVGGKLQSLDGTKLLFCPACSSLIRDIAKHLANKGTQIEEIIQIINWRYQQ